MHGIEKPIDKVISTRNPEWHGLADVVSTIGDTEIAPLCFDIREGAVVVDLAGRQVKMGNHKALVADFRACRPDLVGTEDELTPLHIPKNSYRAITNGEMWEALKKALNGIGADVTCAGTLQAGKKFFMSVELLGESEATINGDKFLSNLNFVTSHDGTTAAQAYDSNVRIVCMNTLRASLESAGEVGFKVYHTGNADVAVQNMGELVNAVLAGRANFRTSLEYLASVPMDARAAQEIALGYLLRLSDKDEASTRALNAAEEISNLFSRGKGNRGVTAYDLLNGATEYWTHGDGTGKKAGAGEKAFKAGFGTAADHKNAFFNLLMGGADAIARAREAGRAALLIDASK